MFDNFEEQLNEFLRTGKRFDGAAALCASRRELAAWFTAFAKACKAARGFNGK